MAGCGKEASPTETVKITTPVTTPVTTPTVETKTVTVHSDSRVDGFVAANGRVGDDPIAGELSPDSRAFLSFDLTSIPAGSTIKSATLSLNGAIASGDPFALGQLQIYSISYGQTLDSTAFRADGPQIASWSSLSTDPFDVKNFVKPNTRFQVRLQFSNTESRNSTTDYLTFPSDRMTLVVEYQ